MASLREMLNKQKEMQAAPVAAAKPSILSSIARPKGLSIAEQIAAARGAGGKRVDNPAAIPERAEPQPAVVDAGDEDNSILDDMDMGALGIGDEAVVSQPEISAEDFQFPTQPDTMSPAMEGELLHAFDMLRASIDDPTNVGQATQYIINLLQDRPELKGNLAPDDFGLMVRGLRTGYGVAIAKKSERKERVVQRKQSVVEAADMLAEIGGLSFKL